MDEQLRKAQDLRKARHYEKAVKLYDTLWPENSRGFNQWDGWGYAYCLFKIQQFKKSLNICRSLYPRDKDFNLIRSLYARNIYYTQFKASELPSSEVLQKALHGIFKLSSPYEPYSVCPKAVFDFAKIAMGRQQVPWREIEKWLKRMDPNLLDGQAFVYENPKGRSVSMASNQEQWYATMLRVKAGQNKPEELLQVLKTTRQKGLRWHYNNDIWFARKEAFAHYSLGQKEKAIRIMRKVLLRKQDWFLLFDLAKMLEKGDEKLQLYCQAALKSGKKTHKLKLYLALGNYLKDENKEMANLHFALEAAIRSENNWEISIEKQDLLNRRKEEGLKSADDFLKKLKNFWKTHLSTENQRQNGIIEFVFPHQKSGFLKSGKKKIFFVSGKMEGKLDKGSQVSFMLKDSYDKKKKKASIMAVSLQLKKQQS